MKTPQYIPSFYFYKFANAVSAPYTSLNAYRAGVIDEEGNLLSTEGSIDDFEYFVIKLKKIFDQLPPGMTKSLLTNVIGVAKVFSEDVEKIGITQEQVIALLEAHVTINSNNELSAIELFEEMATGGMSTGSSPGEIGTPAEAPSANKGNVSGYDPIMMALDSRSGPVNMFQGIEMFNLTPQQYKIYKDSKAWRHIPDDETKRYLQRLQRRNKGMKIGVRDEESGEIFFLPHKEKSFVEEFCLQGLSILNEEEITTAYQDSVTDKTQNQATLTNKEEENPSKDPATNIPEVYALDAFANFLENLGGYTDPETKKTIEPLLHPTKKTPLRSYKRRAYFIVDPKTNKEVVDTSPLKPGEFRISSGGSRKVDVEIRDFDDDDDEGYAGNVEIKSLTDKPRFNIDISDTAAPKSQAAYLAIARGIGFPGWMRKMIRGNNTQSPRSRSKQWRQVVRQEVEDISGSSSLDLVKAQKIGLTPGIERKELQQGLGTRIYNTLRKAFIKGVGKEKGGLLFGLNPEGRQLTVIDMVSERDAKEQRRVQRMLENMGGVKLAGTLLDFAVDPKMARSASGRNMLRMDVKDYRSRKKELERIRRENGELAFGAARGGEKWARRPRTTLTAEDAKSMLRRLTR